MVQIFISYSQVDHPFVKALADKIQRVYGQGSVWFDKELYGGTDWWQRILDQIAARDIFVYVLTNELVNSKYCQAEYQEAKRLHKQVIPVKIREIAELPRELKSVQYVEMLNGVNDADALVDLFGSIHDYMTNLPELQPKPHSGRRTPQPDYVDKSNNEISLNIFINYRESGYSNLLYSDGELAEKLTISLRSMGAEVPFEAVGIKTGEEWGTTVQRELERCDLMLFILSRVSIRSRRVDAAWREFLNQGKPIIVLVNDAVTSKDDVYVNDQLHRSSLAMKSDARNYVDFYRQLTSERKQLADKDEDLRTKFAEDQFAVGLKHLVFKINELFPERLQVADDFPTKVENQCETRLQKDFGALALTTPLILQSRTRFVKFTNMLGRAKKEIYISGITLLETSLHINTLKTFLKDGGHLKCMLIARDDECLKESAIFLGQERSTLEARIQVVLSDFAVLRERFPKTCEIRLFGRRPSLAYFIIDPAESHAEMTVSPYFYKLDDNQREVQKPPFTYLIKRNAGTWFDVYYADFVRMWDDAVEYESSAKT